MPESRPTTVDELLEYLSSLMGILHQMVDVNLEVMERMTWLANQLDLDIESMERLEHDARVIHDELLSWEAKLLGKGSEPSPH